MEYLSSLKFVHRDLAARNCLIGISNNLLIVKVADFGLTRQFQLEKEYYRIRSVNITPYRWMPIEVLELNSNYGIVTSKCDVWSYGVVVWELITRGDTPYGLTASYNQVLYLLKRGERLQQVDCCPDLIYSIMMECWFENPDDRPTFTDIIEMMNQAVNYLRNLMSSTYVNIDFHSSHRFKSCPLNYNQNDIKNEVTLYRSKFTEKARHLFEQQNNNQTGQTDNQYEYDNRPHPPPSYTAATQMPPVNIMHTTTANHIVNNFIGNNNATNNNNYLNEHYNSSLSTTTPLLNSDSMFTDVSTLPR